MRKLLLFSSILLSLFTGLQSCSKESANDMIAPQQPANIINATIGINQAYRLTLDNSGSVSLTKQATHYQVSQTELDNKSGLMVYKYIPQTDYAGTDEVVISSTKTITSSGRGQCNGGGNSNIAQSISYTTIKINITNK